MNELLKKDVAMKAISILIAVILWFIVLDQSNPIEFNDVTVILNILNSDTLTDKNIILKNEDDIPKTVPVKLHGRRDKLKDLSGSDFSVSLDLSKVKDANTTSLRINDPVYITNGKTTAKYFNDVDVSLANQIYVSLELDSIGMNDFQVSVKSSGKPKENIKIISIVSTPEKIQLEGVDSLLKTVGTIRVNVDIANIDRDTESKFNCIILDKKNKDITKSFKVVPSVNIKINVAKEVVVKPIITGTPAPDFLNISNASSPKTVLISGKYEIISKYKQLETVPISIENQNENTVITSELVLPEGVTLVDPSQVITVSLAIEPLLQRTFTFSKEDIVVLNPEADNSLKYNILTTNLSIEIKGLKYDLDRLILGSIKPSIDVSKLIVGTSQVPVEFTLPSTVKLVKDYDIELSVVKSEG